MEASSAAETDSENAKFERKKEALKEYYDILAQANDADEFVPKVMRGLSKKYSISNSSFQRLCAKMNGMFSKGYSRDRCVVETLQDSKRGPKPVIPPSVVEDLRQEAKIKDHGKDSFTPQTFDEALFAKRKEGAVAKGWNDLAVKRVCSKTRLKYQHDIVPDQLNDTSQQVQRRLDALSELEGHISLATMWNAVLLEQPTLLPHQIINMDTTSMLLAEDKGDNNKILLAAGSRAELKRKRLNPASTKSRKKTSYKKRALGMTSSITAAGVLSTVVFKIKDAAFESVQCFKLDAFPGCSYRPWIITVPATERAARLKARKTAKQLREQAKSNSNASSRQAALEVQPVDLWQEEEGEGEGEEEQEYSQQHLQHHEDDESRGSGDEDQAALWRELYEHVRLTPLEVDEDTPAATEKPNVDDHDDAESVDSEFIEDLEEDEIANPVTSPSYSTSAPHSSSSIPLAQPMESDEETIAMLTMRIIIASAKQSVGAESKKTGSYHFTSTTQISQDTASTDSKARREWLNDLRLIITLDGEHFQLLAVDVLSQLDQNRHVEFFKFAASLSMVQQPSDKIPCYRITKRKLRAGFEVAVPEPAATELEASYMEQLKVILKKVEASSRRTFLKAFRAMPSVLHEAFTPRHIKSGFADTGLYPFDAVSVLNHWPSFAQLPQDSATGLVQSVSTLAAHVHENNLGFIDNSTIYEAVDKFLPPHLKKQPSDQVYDLVLNRWGATRINHPDTAAAIAANIAAKKKAAEAAAANPKKRAAKPAFAGSSNAGKSGPSVTAHTPGTSSSNAGKSGPSVTAHTPGTSSINISKARAPKSTSAPAPVNTLRVSGIASNVKTRAPTSTPAPAPAPVNTPGVSVSASNSSKACAPKPAQTTGKATRKEVRFANIQIDAEVNSSHQVTSTGSAKKNKAVDSADKRVAKKVRVV